MREMFLAHGNNGSLLSLNYFGLFFLFIKYMTFILVHAIHDAYTCSYNTWRAYLFIQYLTLILVHTIHDAHTCSYNTWRTYLFIQYMTRILVHTIHDTHTCSYNTWRSYRYCLKAKSYNHLAVFLKYEIHILERLALENSVLLPLQHFLYLVW